MKHTTRLHRSALMLAIAAAYPMIGHGAAGTAQFTTGDVTVRRGAAAPAPLAKGATLESGDAITTGARGIAQLKFSDGGYVSLQPNSQFDITRYADNGNAQQDSFLVNLARGGMRAITGLIGKRNTANYKVTTSTATVGIRGSAFNIVYNPDGTISVATEQDAIEVCTAAGCVGLTAGEAALVTGQDSLPSRTSITTSMQTDTFRRDPVVSGDNVASDGTAAIVEGPRALTGLAFVGGGQVYGGEGTYAFISNDGTLVTEGGRPTSYTTSYNEKISVEDGATATAWYTQGSVASGDYIVAGSWSSAISSGEGYDYAPLAFVAGTPTPTSAISSLTGSTGEYSLRGATPVFTSSGQGELLSSSRVTLNFGSNLSGHVYLDMSLPYGGGSQPISLDGSIQQQGQPGSAGFSGYLSGGGGEGMYYGFVGGSQGQQLGLSYAAYIYAYSIGNIAGGAVFGRDSIEQAAVPLTGDYAALTSYTGGEGYYVNSLSDATVYAQGQKITRFEDGYQDYQANGSNQTLATVGTAGADTFLRMGSWSSVDVSHMESTFDRAAYIVGTPTASISDLNGLTGTYSLHSATPIYMTDGQTGVLNSATMNVNFSSGYSGGSVALGMTLGSYGNLTMSGTFNNQGSSFSVGGITLSQGEGSGSIRGLFSGPGAEYAGLAYGGGGYFGEGDYVAFNGAAILSGSTAPTNPELPANGTYPAMSTVAYLAPWGSTRLDADGSHTFSSAAPTSATGGSASYSGAVAAESGSHGTGADFIGWGRWSAGTDQASNALAGAHYVTGTPTSNVQMPITGSFNYSYVGGSTPISSAGVGGGTVTSANLSANFTDGTANASIATQFDGGLTASMSSNTMSISNGRFSGVDNNNGDGRFSGLFFGNGAGKAGFVYQMQTLNGLGTVTGAVGFEKIPGQPL